jgi:hypothetical protein
MSLKPGESEAEYDKRAQKIKDFEARRKKGQEKLASYKAQLADNDKKREARATELANQKVESSQIASGEQLANKAIE